MDPVAEDKKLEEKMYQHFDSIEEHFDRIDECLTEQDQKPIEKNMFQEIVNQKLCLVSRCVRKVKTVVVRGPVG